jgi:hypothetical protein
LKGRTLEELLHEVARCQESIIVVLEEGELITIEPATQLKPLLVLDGHVPKGWKDAIY